MADRNVQVHGGAGYIEDFRAKQLFRHPRLIRVCDGMPQTQPGIIAKRLAPEARMMPGF